MKPLNIFLEKYLGKLDALQARLSERWRAHASRRSLAVIILAGAFAILSYVFVIQPPEQFPIGELVEVPKGESVRAIAEKLEREGVVRSALALKAAIALQGGLRSVHSGDYMFKEPRDVWSVARALVVGAYGLEPIRIRVTEGATVKSMAALFETRLPRFDARAFIEKALPYEGHLFPDTYFFLPNTREDDVIVALRDNFNSKIAVLESRIAASGRTVEEIVIMASIIEREAHNPAERRMISGVLWNRIRKNMPLQVDVTFLYTIGKNSFQLTKAELRSDSPYNTYVHKGLPPTPIGSPSMDSLEAAVNPTKNDYLFYLADMNGVTHFSKTYPEHKRKKALYLGT